MQRAAGQLNPRASRCRCSASTGSPLLAAACTAGPCACAPVLPGTRLQLLLDLANLGLHADAVHHADARARGDARASKQHALLGLAAGREGRRRSSSARSEPCAAEGSPRGLHSFSGHRQCRIPCTAMQPWHPHLQLHFLAIHRRRRLADSHALTRQRRLLHAQHRRLELHQAGGLAGGLWAWQRCSGVASFRPSRKAAGHAVRLRHAQRQRFPRCCSQKLRRRTCTTRMSAGTRSPVWISTMSPGSSSRAGRSEICGARGSGVRCETGGAGQVWDAEHGAPAALQRPPLRGSGPGRLTLAALQRAALHPPRHARRARTSWPSRKTFAVSAVISLSASSAFSALLSCHTPTAAFSTRMST